MYSAAPYTEMRVNSTQLIPDRTLHQALDVLASGQALSKFLEMLEAQGVSRDTTDKLRERKFEEVLPAAPHQTKIEAKFPGG